MVWDDSGMLRRGNANLTASETPQTHYVQIAPSALRKALVVHIVAPAPVGTPTITHELMECPDTSDPTQGGSWASFNPPIVFTQSTTLAQEKDLFCHPRYGYLGVKSTVSGGSGVVGGAVTIGVVAGTTGAGAQPY